MLGDVLTDGTTPPQLPVVVMRRQLLPEDASIIRSGGRPLNMDKPAMAHPMSYLLIWRNSGLPLVVEYDLPASLPLAEEMDGHRSPDGAGKGRAPKYVASGDSPLSIWWPVAPDGYNALGCVAVPALEEPPLSLVGCPRRDLVQIADLEGSPIWKARASICCHEREFCHDLAISPSVLVLPVRCRHLRLVDHAAPCRGCRRIGAPGDASCGASTTARLATSLLPGPTQTAVFASGVS